MDRDRAQVILDGYFASLALEKGLAENSLLAYRRDLGDLIEFLEPEAKISNWEDVQSVDISRYLMSLYDIGIAPATVNRRLSAIRGLFAFLYREGVLSGDPAAVVAGPRSRRHLPDVLDIVQIELLLAQPETSTPGGSRDRAMLELAYGCGLRVTELVSLPLEAFRDEGRLLLILGKGGKQRFIPVGDCALAAVADYLQRQRPFLIRAGVINGEALFLTQKEGKP